VNKPNNYFPQLTGIRAIAAYMVFVYHYIAAYKPVLPTWLYAMLSELHIGVPVFFVLSGFLIAYRYMDKIEVSRKWMYQYFKNRIARIYPMYFLLTTFAFLYYHYHSQPQTTVPVYLLNITFLRGFFNEYKFSGIGQGWSLTVEECFYAVAPIIFLLRVRINIWVMAAFMLCLALAMVVLFKDANFHQFFSPASFVFTYTYFGRCLEFFIGIQLAMIIKSTAAMDKCGIKYTLTGAVGVVACLYMFTFFIPSADLSLSKDMVKRLCINNVLCPIFISLLFYGLLTEASLFRRFLATPLMKLLGESSYIFYLIHVGFIYEIVRSFLPTFSAMVPLLFIILNIISILLFKLIEHPVNGWIRAHFNGEKQATKLPSSAVVA